VSDRGNPDANDVPMVWVVDPSIDGYEPLIDSERVVEILKDCLYTGEELDPLGEVSLTNLPEGAVIAEGIMHPFGFHPERLESHRAEVTTMLQNLPQAFRETEHGGGGGWSFLMACNDRNDVQWTGLHQTMDALFSLGKGLGLVEWLMPRELWPAFPGGMPYVVVKC
jgi:hypothetical protein